MAFLWRRRGAGAATLPGRAFKAVAMDIDGTLTSCDTLGLTSTMLGLPAKELAAVNLGYMRGELTYEQTRESVLRRWCASGRADRDRMAEIFHSMPLRTDAFRLLARIRENSLHSCLITSSMDFYAQTMAERLGVPDYYANVLLDFDESGGLCGMEFTKEAALLKREQLLAFCREKGIAPEEVMVIGNADNDREMFEVTGNGVLIGDEGGGALAAGAWRTVRSLSEAADLL